MAQQEINNSSSSSSDAQKPTTPTTNGFKALRPEDQEKIAAEGADATFDEQHMEIDSDLKVPPTQIAERASGEEAFSEIENKGQSRLMNRDRQSRTNH